VIIGGGFSGLWTAHHLIERDANLKIAILEKDQIGSGASGRNGGWVSALYPVSDTQLAKNFSAKQIHELHTQLEKAIDEIGKFIKTEKIECGFHKGGTITVARNGGQLERISHDQQVLTQTETVAKISMDSARGSTFTPHCAAINPAALVIGLAKSLENRGVAIFEKSPATLTRENQVFVLGHELQSLFVVRAIEAYLEQTRVQIPIYSLVVATEPLSNSIISAIGLSNRETFSEASHLVTYAQLTQENRLVIGGRGAPYSWGSRRKDSLENREKDHDRLRVMAREWFPVLQKSSFTHTWGGAVGITRDWSPYVRVSERFGEMGGYVGDGVTLSYLAAAAMADCIVKKDSERTRLPFVQWKGRRWEREPWRWVAVNSAIRLTFLADREERLTNRPSLIMKSLAPLLGR
jgi:glycine/D-amino acid oxidase-like deaminating enzyme